MALRILFKNHPELAVDLLTLGGVEFPDGCTACAGDPALVPGDDDMTVDAVTLLKDAAGVTRFGVIVELVDDVDEVRRRGWPILGRLLELRERATCKVLVMALTDQLRAWADGRQSVASA